MRRTLPALLCTLGCATASTQHAAPAVPPADPAAVAAFVDEIARAPTADAAKAACAQRLHWEGPMDQCEVRPALEGRVALVRVAPPCSEGACGMTGYLVRDATPRKLPGYSGGALDVLPDGRTVIADHVGSVTGTGGLVEGWTVVLVEIDAVTGTVRTLAEASGPRVSPTGHYITGRNRRGDVLRWKVGGGPLEKVGTSGLVEAEVAWEPGMLVFPGPVEFEAPDRVRAATQLKDPVAPAHVFTAPWAEP